MKLFIFLVGLACGAFGLHLYYTLYPAESPGYTSPSTSAPTHEASLSGSALREELNRTGKIVRTKAAHAGQVVANSFANTKVVSVINAKLALDKDLSARAINVDAQGGVVTLTGTVPTNAALSKAVALALDTEGVTQVVSYLVVPAHVEPTNP